MTNGAVCCICRSEAIRFASKYLQDRGLNVTTKCAPDVRHLLLPVPSFLNGAEYLAHLLSDLPEDITIYGGNLDSPIVQEYRTVDFLKDPYYLAHNAAITARCALQIVKKHQGQDLTGYSVLILGWGRIGKCLAKLMQTKGADVTIAARKDTDLAMIQALGYGSTPIAAAAENLEHYQVILNTVPAMILPEMYTRPDCIILELASKPGMIGENIISARGLPGKMAPEASGKLIAETFLRLSHYNKEE